VRILLINKFWKPFGGVEEHCRNLATFFSGEGHEIVRFGMADPANEPPLPAEQTVTAVSFHGRGIRERSRAAARACVGLETRSAIKQLLAHEKFDVAHVVHAYHQLGMTFLPVLRKAGVPTILDLHDYKVGCPRYLLFDDDQDRPCYVCIERPGAWAWAPVTRRCWNGSRASGVLLTVEALSARLSRAYTAADGVVVRNSLQARAAAHVGVARDRIRVIPNWVADAQGKERASGDHFLFAGRLVREKGVHTLLAAAMRARVGVRVVGDGPMRTDLESLVRPEKSDFAFLGWAGHDEVLEEIRTARALVVPSIWPEVFPLVICEAFAAGVPVIGSDIGGISDLLADDRGYLFTPGDEAELGTVLREVVNDPSDASRRAGRARDYSREHLSHDSWREQYRSVYRDVLGERPAIA
jgi:glycosyltransferase involved in cell wall biosynthesis